MTRLELYSLPEVPNSTSSSLIVLSYAIPEPHKGQYVINTASPAILSFTISCHTKT